MSISLKWKKIFQKEKYHSSVFWKAFQISTNYFSLHRHFNSFAAVPFINSNFDYHGTLKHFNDQKYIADILIVYFAIICYSFIYFQS